MFNPGLGEDEKSNGFNMMFDFRYTAKLFASLRYRWLAENGLCILSFVLVLYLVGHAHPIAMATFSRLSNLVFSSLLILNFERTISPSV